MAAQHPERYRCVVAEAKNGGDVQLAEHEHYGTTHGEWGGRIARAWKLPDLVVDAIEQHHAEPSHGLAEVIRRARGTVYVLAIGNGVIPGAPSAPDEALLDLTEAWEHRLAQDEWSWRAISRTGGLRELAVRSGLNPDGAAGQENPSRFAIGA